MLTLREPTLFFRPFFSFEQSKYKAAFFLGAREFLQSDKSMTIFLTPKKGNTSLLLAMNKQQKQELFIFPPENLFLCT